VTAGVKSPGLEVRLIRRASHVTIEHPPRASAGLVTGSGSGTVLRAAGVRVPQGADDDGLTSVAVLEPDEDLVVNRGSAEQPEVRASEPVSSPPK
jgi:hypothetical protein